MKRNLLDIVQEILSDLDSDEVNSIDDTVESEQVVTILKSTYYAMLANRDWPHTRQSIQLSSLGDVTKPTYLKLQDGVKSICFVNYNKIKQGETKKTYSKVEYLEPEQFIYKTNLNDSTASNVQSITDFGGIEFFVRNDRAPSYYTSFDDEHITFDSFDSTVDSSVQQSKVQCQAYVTPSWSSSDSFIPDLPESAFPAFVEEAKAKAFFVLKQTVNQKAEQEAGRQNRWLARNSRRVNGGVKYPSYGRGRVNLPGAPKC